MAEKKLNIGNVMMEAFQLGQIYWQQADSDSYSQNKKSDRTQELFDELREDAVESATILEELLIDIHDDYLARVSRKIPDYRGDPDILTDIDPKIWKRLKRATNN